MRDGRHAGPIGMRFPRCQTLGARRVGARGNAIERRFPRRGDRRSHVLQQGGIFRRPLLCGWWLRMQLKPKAAAPQPQNARRRLMAASCALLSAGAARGQQANVAPAGSGLLEDWSVDSALAYYHEDGRIHAIEPVADLAKVFADGRSLNFNVTFDALSGASPNGALTSHAPQTFASPSGTSLGGSHSYTTGPGQLPVDPNYHDDRLAVGGSWTVPVTRVTQVSVGGKLSDEHDFVSASVNAS